MGMNGGSTDLISSNFDRIVDGALELVDVYGARRGAGYLDSAGVPLEVALRVIARPGQRRARSRRFAWLEPGAQRP